MYKEKGVSRYLTLEFYASFAKQPVKELGEEEFGRREQEKRDASYPNFFSLFLITLANYGLALSEGKVTVPALKVVT